MEIDQSLTFLIHRVIVLTSGIDVGVSVRKRFHSLTASMNSWPTGPTDDLDRPSFAAVSSGPHPISIALLGGTAERHRTIVDIAGTRAHVAWYARITARGANVLAQAPEITVADFEDQSGNITLPLLRALRRRWRHACIILCVDASPDDFRRALSAAAEGVVNDVVFAGEADWSRVIRRRLRLAERQSFVSAIDGVTRGKVPHATQIALEWAASRVELNLTVEAWAAGLSYDRKTLSTKLKRAGLPVPHAILGWHRVLFVAHRLSSTTLSVGGAARALKFNSAADVSRLVRRYLAVKPSSLRRTEAFDDAVRAYSRAMLLGSSAPVAEHR